MKPLYPDTHPKVEEMLIEGYRKMTPQQKLNQMRELIMRNEMLLIAYLKTQYPEASDYELRLRAASRRVPADLMKKAFGWGVEKEGY